jgi:hypothetical protein
VARNILPRYAPQNYHITQPVVIITEGRDEQAMCESAAAAVGAGDLDILNASGRHSLRATLSAVALDVGFSDVRSIGVIRDADNDEQASLRSVLDALRAAGMPAPSTSLEVAEDGTRRVVVLILPGGGSQGEIEDLCLRSLADTPLIGCVDDYFRCVERIVSMPAKLSKARLQTYLATMPEHTRSIGVALRRRYIDIDNAAFSSVRRFIDLLVQ